MELLRIEDEHEYQDEDEGGDVNEKLLVETLRLAQDANTKIVEHQKLCQERDKKYLAATHELAKEIGKINSRLFYIGVSFTALLLGIIGYLLTAYVFT